MKITERGQVTIPKAIRERFGLHKDVEIEFVPGVDGVCIQKRTRAQHPVDRIYGILKKPASTDDYIEEIRGK